MTVALALPLRDAGALSPPLKWAGGKRWLVPWLRQRWRGQEGRRLVEPFCGGMAIALGLQPDAALLNDINPHAINFYRWLQRGLILDFVPLNEAQAYYRYRDEFNQLIDQGRSHSRRAAGLFYYLNRTGYNGLCRFNRQGHFNVPFGRYRKINYTMDFSAYREVLAPWQFHSEDFTQLPLQPQDFLYCDPPYDVPFTQYAQGGFGWEDQVRLAHWLCKHPGPVIASNQATERIVDLYTDLGFHLEPVTAPRMISCKGDRTPAQEVLALRGI